MDLNIQQGPLFIIMFLCSCTEYPPELNDSMTTTTTQPEWEI
jgi:hypothetical protein